MSNASGDESFVIRNRPVGAEHPPFVIARATTAASVPPTPTSTSLPAAGPMP